ncbi:MAG TPA: response regulator [Balneolaceae bacterium]|nr:response regulator [Balneolaceae bacterium]
MSDTSASLNSTDSVMTESKKKVFVVEDDLILNLLYENYMEQLGFETEGELVYGKTAVDLAKKINPDLILMDIALEGDMDGIEAMLEIRKFSDVPVIYITGNSDESNRTRAIETNYTDFLTKPVEFEDLKESLIRAKIISG